MNHGHALLHHGNRQTSTATGRAQLNTVLAGWQHQPGGLGVGRQTQPATQIRLLTDQIEQLGDDGAHRTEIIVGFLLQIILGGGA